MTENNDPGNNNLIVNTTTGYVEGFLNASSGQSCFWGIPYAEPPLGELRFKKTVEKKPWDGVRSAKAFGSSGPQIFDITEGSYEEFTGINEPQNDNPWIGNEDNLTLNIWTPCADNKKRPVIVWVHGGANWLESSRLHTYHGDVFVERGEVVFVSINYRLGVFGWLDLSVLGGDGYKGSHSNGLRDQVCALKWIRDNIESFGGDKQNITVMGESAGSIDLSWLLTNGHLNGIARRVVLMSGVAGLIGLSGDLKYGFSEDFAKTESSKFLKKMGISSIGSLLSMTTDDVMERVSQVVKTENMLFVMDSQFWPRVSEDFTPLDPFRAAQIHGSHGIDVMVGYTSYEMGLWLFWDDALDQHPCDWYAKQLNYQEKSKLLEDGVHMYESIFTNKSDGVAGMQMVGDSIFVMPTYFFADMLLNKGENVWVYQFDWQADARKKALHAADQAFLFGKLETHTAGHLLGKSASNEDMARRSRLSEGMMAYILSYATIGIPVNRVGSDGLVWGKYDETSRLVMSFDFHTAMLSDPVSARRTWWYTNMYLPAFKA